MNEKDKVLIDFLNAKNQDFQSELNIFMQLDKILQALEDMGAKSSEVSGVRKFKQRFEKVLKKRYNITDEEIENELSEEGEE